MTKLSIFRSSVLSAMTLSFSLVSLPSHSAEPLPSVEVKLHKLDVAPPAIYSPDGKLLAGNSATGIKLMDASSEKVLKTLDGKAERRGRIVFSPDSRLLAYAAPDHTVKVWDVASDKLVHTLSGHTKKVNGVTFSRDGKLLATGGADKTIKIWDVKSGELLRTMENSSMIGQLNFVLDKHQIASLDVDYLIKLWDADEGKLIRKLDGNHQSFTISDDGKTLVSCQVVDPHNTFVITVESLTKKNFDSKLTFVDLETGKVLRSNELTKGMLAELAISPDNKTIAGGNIYDYSIGFWDADTEKELRRIKPGDWPATVQFSRDGRKILYVTDAGDAEDAYMVVVYPLDKDDVLKERVAAKK